MTNKIKTTENYSYSCHPSWERQLRENKQLTAQDLINFENDIIKHYEAGEIRGPVHMHVGAEEPLIKIFKDIKPNDWIFSTHRSHYHALLKSKNPEWVKQEIMEGRSQHINSAKYKIFTSAIVGGVLPIATGVALNIKREKKENKVYCFLGDMASEMGLFHESVNYCDGHKLPIQFIVEDNGYGVNTKTEEVWGKRTKIESPRVSYFNYERVLPHHGTGSWINFKDENKPHDGRVF